VTVREVHAGHAPGIAVHCGLMDMLMADLSTSVVFFFAAELDAGRLATGLAQALRQVPVFGGRLRAGDGTLEIDCSDAGVPLAVSALADSLPEAIGRLRLPGPRLADHIDARAARAGGQPLLTVRVSALAGGGTAVGCSWHHAVGDMGSFALLMRAWSAAVDGTPAPVVSLQPDPDAVLARAAPATDSGRPGFRLLTPAEEAEQMPAMEAAVRGTRTVQVHFTGTETARMRDRFSELAGRKLSRNDVLCGHLVSTVCTLHGSGETRFVTMPVDLRRRLGIPPGTVGNLMDDLHPLPYTPPGPPEALAADIRTALENFTTSHLSVLANQAALAAIGRPALDRCAVTGFDLSWRTVTVTNWCGFGLADISFGGHRPVFAGPALNFQLPWGAFISEGPVGDGCLVTVAVPARLAAALRSPAGREALHPFREPGDRRPGVTGAIPGLL
jgi:hypothetical protein